MGFAFWVLGVFKPDVLGASLSFALHIVVVLLCLCPCLFDAGVELHVEDEKMFNDLLIAKWK